MGTETEMRELIDLVIDIACVISGSEWEGAGATNSTMVSLISQLNCSDPQLLSCASSLVLFLFPFLPLFASECPFLSLGRDHIALLFDDARIHI